MHNEFDLTNKNILIIGGAGILGSCMSHALAKHNANIIIADVNLEKAQQLAEEIKQQHAIKATAFQVDITNKESMQALQQQTKKFCKHIDVLLNNAAFKSKNFFEPFESFPIEDWNAVMDVNTTGVMLGCQIFGTDMAKHGRGSIINTLSIYGIVAPDQRIYEGSEYEGRPINTPAIYSTSKAAVWGLTKYLSTYWGHRGVRVNAITPGGVFSGQNDTFISKYSARVPLGRMAAGDEIANSVVFLASDASSYITGQNIIVDGGLSTW